MSALELMRMVVVVFVVGGGDVLVGLAPKTFATLFWKMTCSTGCECYENAHLDTAG